MFIMLAFYIEFKGTMNLHVLEVMSGDMENARGSPLGLSFLIMIQELFFHLLVASLQNLSFCIDFEVGKNLDVLEVFCRAVKIARGFILGIGVLSMI